MAERPPIQTSNPSLKVYAPVCALHSECWLMRLTGKDLQTNLDIYIYPESLLPSWSLLSETRLPTYLTQFTLDKLLFMTKTICPQNEKIKGKSSSGVILM